MNRLMRTTVPVTAIVSLVLCGAIRAETIQVRISSASDDGEERFSNGLTFLPSTDLELGNERDPVNPLGQFVGMRFANVEIPHGATINNASIQFTVDEDDKIPSLADDFQVPGDRFDVLPVASFGIFAELSPNASAFENIDENISTRVRGSTRVQWLDVPSWTGQIGLAGPDQLTPDMSSIVQELVDQADWTSGNAMAFLIEPLTADFIYANRTAVAFDGDAAAAPLFRVDFTPVPEPSTVMQLPLGALMMTLAHRRMRSLRQEGR